MLNFSRLATFSLLAAVGVLAETHTVTFENKSDYSLYVAAPRFKLKHILCSCGSGTVGIIGRLVVFPADEVFSLSSSKAATSCLQVVRSLPVVL